MIFQLKAKKVPTYIENESENAKVRIFGNKEEELKERQQKIHASGLRKF